MNELLLRQLKNSPQLPSLPAIAIQVLDLARRDNVDISEFAELISNDAALSSKILKTVNSSFYGLPKQVSTISHALVILGLQAVKTLALGFSLQSNLRGDKAGGFDCVLFWKRSIYSAVAGRLLARKVGLVQQEEAFLCGLLAGVGLLVMHRHIGPPFDALMQQLGGDTDTLIPLCRARFDLDHAAVSGLLAEVWQLPPVLAVPITQQLQPTTEDPQLRPLVDVVHVANTIGEVFASREPAKYLMQARRALAGICGLKPEEIEALMDEIGTSTRETAKLFEMNIGANRSYQNILDEANQTLISMTLQTQQRVQEVQRENRALQEKAATDPLTGLANRIRFNEFLEEQFQRALRLQRPLSVLFLDLDFFKLCNDTYGHQAGDEVLRRVGKLLRCAVRSVDLAARYGGEEFVLVLTETESSQAAKLAEQIRQALAAEKVAFDGQVLSVTCSIGVAGSDRTRVFQTAAQLCDAADRAAYAAKQAGRNSVRIFRPRPQAEPAPSGAAG